MIPLNVCQPRGVCVCVEQQQPRCQGCGIMGGRNYGNRERGMREGESGRSGSTVHHTVRGAADIKLLGDDFEIQEPYKNGIKNKRIEAGKKGRKRETEGGKKLQTQT